MKNKFILFIAMAVMLFQTCFVTAYADDLFYIYDGDIYYTLDNDGILTIYSETGYYSNPEFENEYIFNQYKDQIKKIVVSDTVTYIESHAFDSCTCECTLLLPASLQTIDGYAFARCPSLTVELDGRNPYFKLVDGVLYSADMTQLIYASPTLTGDFTVPASVTTVCDGAFVFSRFENIIIPDTVTSMMSNAYKDDPEWGDCGRVFAYALSKTITIGKNVKELGRCCIYRCPNLEKLIIKGKDTEMEPDSDRPYVIDSYGVNMVYVPHNSKAEEYMKQYYEGDWSYLNEVAADTVTAAAGESVEISVTIPEDITFTNLGIEIGYDTAALRLTNAVPNSGIAANFTPAPDYTVNPYNMSWDSAGNITFNGTLVTLTFEIITTQPGTYPVTVDFYKGRDGDYTDGVDTNYDESFTPINVVYTSGCVVVEKQGGGTAPGISVGGISFDVTLEADSYTGNIMAALYSGENVLKSVKLYPAAQNLKVSFDKGQTGAYVKIMWWETADSMKPVCGAQIVPLQ